MHSTLIRTSTGLVTLAALAMFSAAAHAKNEKITICHVPPGNPDNAQTITISESAWPAHQGHGDSQGPCPESDEDEDENENEDGDSDSDSDSDSDGDSDGDSGGDSDSGGGATPAGGDGFSVVLCGEPADGKGRRVEVSNVGRVTVQEVECQ